MCTKNVCTEEVTCFPAGSYPAELDSVRYIKLNGVLHCVFRFRVFPPGLHRTVRAFAEATLPFDFECGSELCLLLSSWLGDEGFHSGERIDLGHLVGRRADLRLATELGVYADEPAILIEDIACSGTMSLTQEDDIVEWILTYMLGPKRPRPSDPDAKLLARIAKWYPRMEPASPEAFDRLLDTL